MYKNVVESRSQNLNYKRQLQLSDIQRYQLLKVKCYKGTVSWILQ